MNWEVSWRLGGVLDSYTTNVSTTLHEARRKHLPSFLVSFRFDDWYAAPLITISRIPGRLGAALWRFIAPSNRLRLHMRQMATDHDRC